jgi:hypothetical protein
MSKISVPTLTPEAVVSALLTRLNRRQVEDAVASFATDFRLTDHGIGLEFTDKERLTEFFHKTWELYPDYFVRTEQTFLSGEDVIIQWTAQVTVSEPLYAGLIRRMPLSISGVSIARTAAGKITDWDDYYDGLISRRTALAAYFTEWIEC